MRFVAVLNRDGGTLSSIDLDAFVTRLRAVLETAGNEVEVRIVEGGGIVDALDAAIHAPDVDVVLAGGGDGTISAAAGAIRETDKVLAVLPAGTMNLFARSLGIPLDLDAAIDAFATGRVRAVDVADVNGRPFVHQYSVGMHPQVLRLRSRIRYSSKIGKMMASMRAALLAFLRPPRLNVSLSMKGTEVLATTSGLSVTNNLYGEGHLPYADMPDGGVLGIYVTRARRRRDLAWFLLNMAIGRWRRNEQVEIHQTNEVLVRIRSRSRRFRCAIDGELCDLDPETRIRIHPGTLRVLVPADDSGNKG